MPLRPYQIAAVDRAMSSDCSSTLIVAPTGAGKTTIGCAIAIRYINLGKSVLWVAHRRELIRQARDRLDSMGASSAVVESIQGLAASDSMPDADVVIFDEAHHVVSPEWSRIPERYRSSRIVGLTATPCRLDGVALGEVFSELVSTVTVADLTPEHLCPCEVYAPPARRGSLAMSVADAYGRAERRIGHRPHAIVFCGTVDHAANAAAELNAFGVRAVSLDASTRTEDRDNAIAAFSRGDIDALTNVQILTEGTDLPIADLCVLASGCAHDGSYLQKVGRVLRNHPGKTLAIVADLVGCSTEYGLPSDDRSYSLDGRPIRPNDNLEPIRQCPSCGGVFRASEYRDAACPRCGYVTMGRPDPAVKRAQMSRVFDAHTRSQRQATYRKLAAVADARGYKPGWAAYQFKVRYGQWPRVEDR